MKRRVYPMEKGRAAVDEEPGDVKPAASDEPWAVETSKHKHGNKNILHLFTKTSTSATQC